MDVKKLTHKGKVIITLIMLLCTIASVMILTPVKASSLGDESSIYTGTESLTFNPTGDTYSVYFPNLNIFSSWSYSTDSSWISVKKASGTEMKVTCSVNSSNYERSGNVFVTYKGTTLTIPVTQKTNATPESIIISETIFNPRYAASSKVFTVNCDSAWTYSSSASWICFNKYASNKLMISFTANTTTCERSATVTITCGDQTKTIVITQKPMNCCTHCTTTTTTTTAQSTWG